LFSEFGGFSDALLATFTDADPDRGVANYTAQIDWGEPNAASTGQVSQAGTHFEVRGSHTYTLPGAYDVTVTVTAHYPTDTGTYPHSVATHLSATVAVPAVTLTGLPTTVSAGEWTADPLPLATFSGPPDSTKRYAADVFVGGRGGSIPGRVENNPSGGFRVVMPAERFPTAGNYLIRAVLRDADQPGAPPVGFADAAITVTAPANPAFPDLQSTPVVVVEGDNDELVVASFQLPAGMTANDYTATIDWGDGTAPQEVVPELVAGRVVVQAEPPTGEPGVFGVSVSITDLISMGTADVGTTLIVEDAELAADPTTPTAIERSAGASGVGDFRIATFTNADTTDTASLYRAAVAWGDGAWMAETVYGSGGVFWVGGNHTYLAGGA
jgi:PKD repeat protein